MATGESARIDEHVRVSNLHITASISFKSTPLPERMSATFLNLDLCSPAIYHFHETLDEVPPVFADPKIEYELLLAITVMVRDEKRVA